MAPRAKRPREITVLIALCVLQGLVLVAVGVAAIVVHDDARLLDEAGATADEVLATGIVACAAGALNLVLALGLALHRPLARSIFGVLAIVEAASAVYALVAVRDLRGGTVWALGLSIGILWLLYGSERSQAWFAR